MSVWKSVQPNELWIEALNLASSTCRLTCLPFSSFARVGSLWQARHSSLLIFAGLEGGFGAARGATASHADSTEASTTVQPLRFTKFLSLSNNRACVGPVVQYFRFT